MIDLILRPSNENDADLFLSWLKDESEFDILSGGTLGKMPHSGKELYDVFMSRSTTEKQYTVEYNGVPVGQFTLRDAGDGCYKICYVIIDKNRRKEGLGRQMMSLAVDYCLNELKAKNISLVVFKRNTAAFNCYKDVGFKVVEGKESMFMLMGKEEACYEMIWYNK